MQEFWEVCLDALLDTAKLVPVLFIVYYLIELFEFKCAEKIHNSKLLKGKASPLVGAVVGCVPQCGFSVVSTDLFNKGVISVGALIAVYIATSDEAIPLMLSNVKYAGWAFALIAVKMVYAIIVGYLSVWLYKLCFKNKKQEDHDHEQHQHNESEQETEEVGGHGCCHHHVEAKSFDWLHPMLHCLKICGLVLVVNLIFGVVTDIWIGHDNLKSFLAQSTYLQPIVAILIGLIPNCASSLVLTELFLIDGGLKFSALVAGLCVNAGLGLVVLFKNNKNPKQNLFVLSVLIVSALIIGYGLIFI